MAGRLPDALSIALICLAMVNSLHPGPVGHIDTLQMGAE